MQINTKVQIVLDQQDIEAAISAAIISKLPHLEGVQLSIKLVAGRGESGHRAEVEAVHGTNEAVLPQSDTQKDDTPPFVPEADTDNAQQEEKSEDSEAVENQQRPVFRRISPAQEGEATKVDEPAQQETPTKGGLFKTLTRPDNRNK